MKKQLDIPWLYENISGDKRFDKFIGKPKLSYSAYTSFNEEAYAGEFFGNKFLGMEREGTIFTDFGSAVGGYLEKRELSEYLTDFDISVLEKETPADKKCLYEYEIVIDRGGYVIQGFIDRLKKEGNKAVIHDFKTGAIDKKSKDYESIRYQQTTLYSYAIEQEGYDIDYSGVVLFDRKGNTLERDNKNVLRLTGDIKHIPTPYTTKRAESFLKEFDKTALEIERYWKIFNKYFK